MLSAASYIGKGSGKASIAFRRFASKAPRQLSHKHQRNIEDHNSHEKIMDQYYEKLIVLSKPKEGQRVATHDEKLVIHAALLKEQSNLRKKVVALHWANEVPNLAFVKGLKEIEKRTFSAKGLESGTAGNMLERLKSLREISRYLPQSALALVFHLETYLKPGKHTSFLESLVEEFVHNYNEYLDSLSLKEVNTGIPNHFIEDVQAGMNFELCKHLIKRGNLALISTYLSVMPLPTNVPVNMLNDLIALAPEYMTRKLAAQYSPEQVTLALDKLLAQNHFSLIPVLLHAVPTRAYYFTNLDQLIETMQKHDLQEHWSRLVALIPSAAQLSKSNYALLALHFFQAQQWQNLQLLTSSHRYNTDWASDAQLVEMLNLVFHAHNRHFAFLLINHMQGERVRAIQTQTLDQWATSAQLSSPSAVADFMADMTHTLAKFKLSLPILATQEVPTPKTAPKAVKKETPKTIDLEPSTPPSQAASNQSASTVLPQAKSTTKTAKATKPVKVEEPTIQIDSKPVDIPPEQHLSLILTSRIRDVTNDKPWTEQERIEFIQATDLYQSHYQNRLNLGMWATYIICLYEQVMEHPKDDKWRKLLDTAARSFENFFLTMRPKLSEEHRNVLSVALTRLTHHLWSEGRHSASMSLASVMKYYHLRTDRDLELLIREQSSKSASVSGVSPLDWLKKAVSNSEMEDASFFNSLLSFIQSAVPFNMDEAIKKGGWKSLSPMNQNRSSEAWSALLPIWEKAKKAKWVPNGIFLATIFKLAQLQPQAQIPFYIDVLKYCHSLNLELTPADLPLVYILEEIMNSSNHVLGQYLLGPSGLNLVSALPSNISSRKSLVAFVMRCLAHANDDKTAFLAYRLYSDVYIGNTSSVFSSHCLAMVDAFFHVCATKRNFIVAEKFARAILPLHNNAQPIFTLLIELAGQCGELSSVIRIYKEASEDTVNANTTQLVNLVLHSVAACNVLPLESQRLRVKLDHPDVSIREQRLQTDSFLASIPPAELTRRSRPVYVSL